MRVVVGRDGERFGSWAVLCYDSRMPILYRAIRKGRMSRCVAYMYSYEYLSF